LSICLMSGMTNSVALIHTTFKALSDVPAQQQ
jgi:hypothetical protein